MDTNQSLEQPLENGVQVEVNEPIEEAKDTTTTNSNCSTFGKFKDATSLLNAYENLEKEFTRKSQKLSALLKEETQSKQIEKNNLSQNESVQPPNEIYKQKNWQTNVSAFFNEIPEAKQYAKEISKILMSDKNLARSQDCLKFAYLKALSENNVKPANSLDNPEYFNEIINNKKVREKIINEYISSVHFNKNNLHVISGEPNSISLTQKAEKPKSLKEASQILHKLLNS